MREAELSVTDDELEAIGIGELVSLATDAGLLAFEELTCRGNGAVVQIEVERRCDEDALAGLDYVDTFTHVAERAGSHVYVVSFTAPGLPEHLEATADDLIGTCDPEVDERGATMSIVGPHEAISEQLQRIGGYDGPEYPLDGLTSRQREVVETAWEMGYYEVPKDVSADQVALELGLDSSTVNEHLQRAERNLLEQIL
jgi:hypothetical protein